MNQEQCQAFKAIPGIKSVWVVTCHGEVDTVWTTQEKALDWLDHCRGFGYEITVKEVDNAMS